MIIFLGAAAAFFLVIAGLTFFWWLVDVTCGGYPKSFRPYVLILSGAAGVALAVAYNIMAAGA